MFTRRCNTEQDKQVQVAVPLDGISANLVTDPTRSLTVYVFKERLQIDIVKQTYSSLEEAMKLGINALDALPKTPIIAACFNLNFATDDISPELVEITDCKIDDNISEQGYNIVGRSTTRNVEFKNGLIILSIVRQQEGFNINCNFHLGTQDIDAAKKRLSMPIIDIKNELTKIENFLNNTIEEFNDDDSVS